MPKQKGMVVKSIRAVGYNGLHCLMLEILCVLEWWVLRELACLLPHLVDSQYDITKLGHTFGTHRKAKQKQQQQLPRKTEYYCFVHLLLFRITKYQLPRRFGKLRCHFGNNLPTVDLSPERSTMAATETATAMARTRVFSPLLSMQSPLEHQSRPISNNRNQKQRGRVKMVP